MRSPDGDGGGTQMMRRIISIPEGVYYRGRFRATIVWSKVSRRDGEDNAATVDEERPHGIEEPDKPLRERAISGKTKTSALHMRPAGS
jgi:hypothetical protein